MTLLRLSLVAALAAAALTPPTALAKAVPGDLGKADSSLLALAGATAPGPSLAPNARPAAPGADAVITKRGRVLVSVTTSTSSADATPALRRAGLDVTAATDRAPLPTVEGWLDPADTEKLAALGLVRSIRIVLPAGVDTATAAGTDAGSVTSEGDAAHHGPQARSEFGVSGEGVRVGVISDSMDADGGLAAAQLAGDLPPDVRILADDTPGGSDEGRAMAEIIYDTAPGLDELLFQTGTATGAAGKAQAVMNLAAHGADIIADDIYYLDEPMFQDGTIAQAVDLVTSTGVSYFASAGNRARQSWEGTFSDAGGANDFGGGDTTQTVVTVPSGGYLRLVFQWDEAWGRAQTDLDAYFVNAATSALLARAESDNVTSGLPIETLVWGNGTGAPVQVGLQIGRYSGSRDPFMKYIVAGNIGDFSIQEHATDSDAINPDAASATGSIAVAAIEWRQPGLNVPEPFSSRGLKTRLFDAGGNRLPTPEVRQKPQVAGADGVTTSVPGFAPFYGTSAATPSVAGVATLLRSYRPDFTPDAVRVAITNPANAISCVSARPDEDCGSGFLLADRLLASAKPAPTPPPPTPTPPPAPAPAPTPAPAPQPTPTPPPTAGGPGGTDSTAPARPLRCPRVPTLRRYTLGQALRILDRDGCGTARVTVAKRVRGKRAKHRTLRIVKQKPKPGTPIFGNEKIVLRQGWTR